MALVTALRIVVEARGAISEGPVWDGRHLYFTLIEHSVIMRFDPATKRCDAWARDTERTNGLAMDGNGMLYGCCTGRRAIVRFDADGAMETVVDACDGLPLNTPNDIVIDRQGRIWFSNPWNPPFAPAGQQPRSAQTICRADPQQGGGWKAVQLPCGTSKPNGLLLSADERVLYVAESDFAESGIRDLRAYAVLPDGGIDPAFRTLHTFGKDAFGIHRGIDGMRLDALGNIVATAGWRRSGPGPMLYVFAPSGRILETVECPVDLPTNCAFGGADLRTLYVTTVDGCVMEARTQVPGRGIPLPGTR
ncbi:MAG: SMP-30/gluconolactonase/LRE family protein [Lautropia sp.]